MIRVRRNEDSVPSCEPGALCTLWNAVKPSNNQEDRLMLYLVLAVAASAAMALVLKLFRNQTGNRYGILLGNYLTCVAISFQC